jgi:hypothetical protein
MGQDQDDDSSYARPARNARATQAARADRSEDTGPFAREEELRYQSEHEPLGGCDVEHCQRMHE